MAYKRNPAATEFTDQLNVINPKNYAQVPYFSADATGAYINGVAIGAGSSFSDDPFTANVPSAVTGTIYTIVRVANTHAYTLQGLSAITTAGTATIQLYINGVAVTGSSYAASTTNSTPTALNVLASPGVVIGFAVLASPAPSGLGFITVTLDKIRISAFISGTATTLSVGNSIATVQVAAPTGGTAPFSYQWYRSTTSGFTPSGGNIVVGATGTVLTDSGLTNGTTYYYKNIVIDSVGLSATSNETNAVPSSGAGSNGAFQFNSPNNSGIFAGAL